MAMETPRGAVRSEINVTPLVDVCLVLLIIFMVVAPILHAGVRVDLPQTSAGPLSGKPSQLTVSIAADGAVYLRSERVADANLRDLLVQLHAAEPDRDVIVRCDRHLQYEKVCEVLTALNQAGFTRVGLVTERGREGGGEPGRSAGSPPPPHSNPAYGSALLDTLTAGVIRCNAHDRSA